MKAPTPFTIGETSPFLSATALNGRIMHPLLALFAMRGENGVQIVKADGGFVIKLSDPRAGGVGGGEGGGGTENGLVWAGEWVDIFYAENSVVIRNTTADIEDGDVAGTYVAVQDVPGGTTPPGEVGSEAYWELLARGNWDRLVFRFGDFLIDLDASGLGTGAGSKPRLQIKDTVGLGEIDIRVADCDGKRIYIQEVEDCSGGVAGHRRILASIKY